MGAVVRLKSSEPLCPQIATNDNRMPSSLSRDRLEADSVLSRVDRIQPRQHLSTGLIAIAALSFASIAALTIVLCA